MAGFLGWCGRLWLRWLLTGPVGASGSTCTSAATVAMLLQSLTLGAHQKACDVSRSPAEVCESYCSYECSFFNESAGETGAPANITVFRITPTNVTGIQNKDTGDPSGDITFLLSRKYLAQECARDPTAFGCFLDGDNIYGKFEVEVDGQFGPYFECNPVNVFDQVELDPITQQPPPAWGLGNSYPSPAWIDTRTFECGQGCLQPTAGNCNTYAKKNGTSNFGNAWSCWCDGTGRHNKTVGREAAPYSQHYAPGPAAWVPQCRLAFEEYEAPFTKKRASCVEGTPLRQLSGGWSFESISAMACDACAADAKCEGWRTDDNRTATLLGGRVRASDDEGCVGGVKASHTYPGSSWGTAGDLGGYWFSTPLTAECAAGAPLPARHRRLRVARHVVDVPQRVVRRQARRRGGRGVRRRLPLDVPLAAQPNLRLLPLVLQERAPRRRRLQPDGDAAPPDHHAVGGGLRAGRLSRHRTGALRGHAVRRPQEAGAAAGFAGRGGARRCVRGGGGRDASGGSRLGTPGGHSAPFLP